MNRLELAQRGVSLAIRNPGTVLLTGPWKALDGAGDALMASYDALTAPNLVDNFSAKGASTRKNRRRHFTSIRPTWLVRLLA